MSYDDAIFLGSRAWGRKVLSRAGSGPKQTLRAQSMHTSKLTQWIIGALKYISILTKVFSGIQSCGKVYQWALPFLLERVGGEGEHKPNPTLRKMLEYIHYLLEDMSGRKKLSH